jgi:hypothetical protein
MDAKKIAEVLAAVGGRRTWIADGQPFLANRNPDGVPGVVREPLLPTSRDDTDPDRFARWLIVRALFDGDLDLTSLRRDSEMPGKVKGEVAAFRARFAAIVARDGDHDDAAIDCAETMDRIEALVDPEPAEGA